MPRTAWLGLLLLLLLAAPAPAAEPPAGWQGGPSHSGSVEASVAPPLGKRWVRDDIGTPRGLALYEGRVFVTTYDRDTAPALYALDAASGATIWKADGVSGRISVSDGLVFALADQKLVARDAASGAVAWVVDESGSSSSITEPVADGDLVFTGGDGIVARRTSDGMRMWSRTSDNAGTGMVAADETHAYVVGCGGALLAARRTLGLPGWEHSGNCLGGGSPEPPVVAQGRVWGSASVHDAAGGALLTPWQESAPAVAADRTVTAGGSKLVTRDFEGRVLWEVTAPDDEFNPGTPVLYSTPPLIVGGVVYVADDRSALGYSLADGALLWRSTTRLERSFGENHFRPSGLAARGDRLVVPFHRKLLAFGPGADTPGVDPDPWRDPAAVTLSLKSNARKIRFGGSIQLHAHAVRKVGGDVGQPLTLQADAFPYGDWQDVQQVRTEPYSSGEYLTLRPDRNTLYRLRHTGVDPVKYSDEVEVAVDLGFDVSYRYLSRTRLRATAVLRGPADALRGARMRVPFYFFRRSSGWATRLGHLKLRRRSVRSARGRVVLRVPRRFGRKDYVFPCLVEKRDDGFGRFQAYQPSCGRKRLR